MSICSRYIAFLKIYFKRLFYCHSSKKKSLEKVVLKMFSISTNNIIHVEAAMVLQLKYLPNTWWGKKFSFVRLKIWRMNSEENSKFSRIAMKKKDLSQMSVRNCHWKTEHEWESLHWAAYTAKTWWRSSIYKCEDSKPFTSMQVKEQILNH